MVKKFLGIVVLGLLWCNTSFAEIIEFKCSSKTWKYANFYLDKENKILKTNYQLKGKDPGSATSKILYMDNQKVEAEYISGESSDARYTWYYGTDQHMESSSGFIDRFNCKTDYVSSASSGSSSSSSTDDKIAQAKQICKDLGFKTKTEKFADCSLKMLSMQFEVQNREALSGGGTQQRIVVNQGYDLGDAMIALSGIISDANNVRSSYGGGNCRIFQHAYHASIKCN